MKLRTFEPIYRCRKVGRRALSLFLACLIMMGIAAPALSVKIAFVEPEGILPKYTSGELTDGDGTYAVRIVYGEDAEIPEGASLVTREVFDDAYLTAAEETFSDGRRTVYSRFFDITILDAENNPIQPAVPVNVFIESFDQELIPEDAELNVFHYPEETDAEPELANDKEGFIEEQLISEEWDLFSKRAFTLDSDLEAVEDDNAEPLLEVEPVDAVNDNGTVDFAAKEFSVYGVIWTVDFSYGTNGFNFDYSIEGGTAVSLRELLPVLGIAENEEEINQFCAGVKSVEFSDPELIAVAHTEIGTTVEELVEVLELDIEFSADLSEEEIDAIYNKPFASDEWVLIGLRPFDTKETLTITMDNGEVFAITVEDARLTGTVITAAGERYVVEVIYDEDAGIPENAYLTAEEVEIEREAVENAIGSSDWFKTEIAEVRSFDIAIHAEDGTVIEPLTPVHVQIRLEDGLEKTGLTSVVHFTQDGETEILDAKTRSGSAEDTEEVVITFETASFSSFAVTAYNGDISGLDGQTYALVLDNPLGDKSERHALQSIEHTQSGRLRGYAVFSEEGATALSPANGISGWTFEAIEGEDYSSGKTEYKYYLKAADGPNEGKYLNISTKTSDSGKGLTMTDTPQALTVQVKSRGRVRISVDAKGRPNAIRDYDNGSLSSGFASYRSKNGKAALEFFNLYPILPPPATDTLGLGGKSFVVANQYNGTGSYTAVNPNTDTNAVGGTPVTVDEDGFVTTETAPKWTFVFSGEEDKYFIRPSTDPTKYISIGADGSVVLTETPTALTVQKVEDKDRYIVKNDSGIALTNNGAGGFGGVSYPETGNLSAELGLYKIQGELELDPPSANKVLEPNNDGTYTLTLSVKGTSKEGEQTTAKKSNVLFVMDRSSSMVTNGTYLEYKGTTYPSTTSFYGFVNNQPVSINYDQSNDRWVYRVGTWWGGFQENEYPASNGIYTLETRLYAEQLAMNDVIRQLMAKNSNDANITDLIDVNVISFATKAGNQQERSYPYDPSIHNIPDTGSWANGRSWGGTESGWQNGTSTTALENAVNDNDVARGTNWEEALKYAKDVMDAKKASDGAEEDYYIIFLTDGAPTATTWSLTKLNPSTTEWGAWYYSGSGHGNDDWGRSTESNEPAYQDSMDEAKALVDAGYKLYNIYTYGENNDYQYMVRLTNYAYGDTTYNPGSDYLPATEAALEYFENATDTNKLVKKFEHILSKISASASYGRVKITDILTQDSLTTTLVPGSAGGFRYTVKNASGTLYTVTASDPETVGGNPSVTFNIPGLGTFPGQIRTLEHIPIPGSDPVDYADYDYYVPDLSSLNNENLNPEDYKIALADVDENGQVSWNLTGIGTLRDGYTYEVDFVVWPNQEAFDYVSGLNNHAEGFIWDTSLDTYENLVGTKGYEIGGVKGFPSIVRYPDGTFAVLTNKGQKLDYSTVETKTDEEGTTTIYTEMPPEDLPLPEPMKLIDTNYLLRKQWDASSNLSQLVKFLYNTADSTPGNLISYKKSVEFRILQDGDPYQVTKTVIVYETDPVTGDFVLDGNGNKIPVYETDPLTGNYILDGEGNKIPKKEIVYETNPETGEFILDSHGDKIPVKEDVIIFIGWNEEENDYIWGGEITKVTLENSQGTPVDYEVGSYWDTDYYISVGVMLSAAMAAERRIDTTDLKTPSNPNGKYIKAMTESGDVYYLLEEGHEYTIDEQRVMLHDYHFDFISDTYHPMQVDGKKKDVLFKRGEDGKILVDDNGVYTIEDMTADGLEMPPLTGYNTLRGSLVVQKEVRDFWGNTVAPGECADTFKITIQFQNAAGTFVVEDYQDENGVWQETDHVPWFSVNGGYYCLYHKTDDGYEMVYHDDGTPIYVANQTLGAITQKLYDTDGNLVHDPDPEAVKKIPNAHLRIINGLLYMQDEKNTDLNRGDQLTYSLLYDKSDESRNPIGTSTMPDHVMLADSKILDITAENLSEFVWYGNRMVDTDATDGTVRATIYITNNDVIEIVNVPAYTEYTVSEVELSNLYLYVNEKTGPVKVVTDPDTGEERYVFDGTPTETETMTVHGEIAPNAKTGILFTNRQKPTYDVTIQKNDQSGGPLKGAHFDLYTEEQYEAGEEAGFDSVTPIRKDLVSSSEEGKEGQIYLGDLGAGKYYLVETKAPDGYNLLTGPVVITVYAYDTEDIMIVNGVPYYVQYSGNGTETPMTSGITVRVEEREIVDDSGTQATFTKYFYTLTVKNTSGYELPSTGGMGTTIFCIVGGLLAVGAGVVLVAKKRMGKVED